MFEGVNRSSICLFVSCQRYEQVKSYLYPYRIRFEMKLELEMNWKWKSMCVWTKPTRVLQSTAAALFQHYQTLFPLHPVAHHRFMMSSSWKDYTLRSNWFAGP